MPFQPHWSLDCWPFQLADFWSLGPSTALAILPQLHPWLPLAVTPGACQQLRYSCIWNSRCCLLCLRKSPVDLSSKSYFAAGSIQMRQCLKVGAIPLEFVIIQSLSLEMGFPAIAHLALHLRGFSLLDPLLNCQMYLSFPFWSIL